MKRIIFLFSFLTIYILDANSQTTHTINVSGFSFNPSSLTIEIGDIVVFNGSANHPVLEVSEDTWNANGNTALSGGFAFSAGSGNITFDEEGEHFYICENHISSGMKGKISVIESTATNIIKTKTDDVKVYPNPLTSGYIFIEIPNNNTEAIINIYDITGRLKINNVLIPANDKVKLDGSNLSPGAYILQVSSGKIHFTSKIIKN